jgi:hypothetical protein
LGIVPIITINNINNINLHNKEKIFNIKNINNILIFTSHCHLQHFLQNKARKKLTGCPVKGSLAFSLNKTVPTGCCSFTSNSRVGSLGVQGAANWGLSAL